LKIRSLHIKTNIMKKNIFVFLICIFIIPGILHAQRECMRDKGKFESLRMAIYTSVLDLTPDEASRFWPVHNEMENKLRDVNDKAKKDKFYLMLHAKDMSDEEITKAIFDVFAYEEESINIKKAYAKEFLKILPAQKVLLIRKAELEFKKALLDKVRHSRGGGPQIFPE
jgi:hypothetical protein